MGCNPFYSALFALGIFLLTAMASAQETGLTPVSKTGELPAPIADALRYHGISTDHLSLLVQPLNDDENLISVNASVPRNPASIMKLVTSYAAIEMLGLDYRWRTRIFLEGKLENGVLDGNLIWVGGGDPFLSVEDTWRLLSRLRTLGLRDIKGDLIIDDSLYPYDLAGAGTFDGQPNRVYNLPPNPIMVNFQSVRFEAVHHDGGISVAPTPNLPNLDLNNRLKPKAGACRGFQAGVRIDIDNAPARDLIRFSGQHPTGCERYALTRTVLQPDTYLEGLFRLLWAQLGGELQGEMRTDTYAPAHHEPKQSQQKQSQQTAKGKTEKDRKDEPFLSWPSRPLAEIVYQLNKYSNNTMTRALLISIALEHGSNAPESTQALQDSDSENTLPGTDSVDQPETPQDRLVALGKALILEHLQSKKLPVEQLQMLNGSGLSRDVRADAQLFSMLLRQAYESPYMPEYFAALPLNGIDGTLTKRLRHSRTRGRAHLKTGQLDHVTSLAGLVQARSGRRYRLVMMINYPNVHRGVGKDIGDALIEWIYDSL